MLPDGTNGKWLPLTTVTDEASNQAIASTWYLAHFAFLGVASPAPAAGAGQVEVIVDDLDDEFVRYQSPECEGYWWHYWSEDGTHDGHSYYTKDSDAEYGRQNWGEWTPNLPENAAYQIWAFIPWGHATTTSAHYSIEKDSVQIGAVTVNQLDVSADWVSLGSYSLPAGTHSKVVLDDMTNDPGYAGKDIGFDALKFVCLDCGATPTPTPQPTPMAFQINSVAAVDAGGTDLIWDALVMSDDDLTLEARGTGDNPPGHVWARVEALQSGRGTGIRLAFSHTSNGTHVYRGTHAASELVNRPSVLTVAAVVYEEEDFDYQVAETFMEDLGVPATRRMGIAWGTGDQVQNRPPANIDYFRTAGYETARVSMIYYPSVTPDEFFIQNQADVLFYLGHGAHKDNYVYLAGSDTQGDPEDIGDDDAWDKGLETVIFFACSVLDINNYDGCADDDKSPGKTWIELAGPQTWLGFKWTAPTAVQGRSEIQTFAAEYVSSGDWIAAWQTATGENLTSFRHAVAIDSNNYYYWNCSISYNDPDGTGCWCGGMTTWDTVPRADLDSSNRGLEMLVASPVEIHVYDRQGRHVGPDGHGGIDTEIPGSAYWTPIVAGDSHPDARRVSIPAGDLSHGYQIALVGTGDGQFDFYLEIPDRSTGALYHADYLSVTVAVADEFALALARGTGFVLAADRDGDGIFEGQVAPSSTSNREISMPVNLVLEGTAGENGWYKSDVEATLQGSTRPDFPPLTSLEYDLGSGWQTFTTPLALTQEGTHTLNYRGAFVGGAQDVAQWVSVRQDKTPPTLTLTAPTAITYTLCPYTGTTYPGAFTVTYQADDAISGLQTVSATLAGVGLEQASAITNGQTLETLFLFPGPHKLDITARDRAGWQTVHKQPIFIQTQIEDLNCAVTRLWSLGLISGPDAGTVVTDLRATLSAAQTARDGGDMTAAVGHLHTFVLDVVDQTPAPISVDAARVLARGAQYATNQIAGEIIIPPAFGGQLTSPDFDVIVSFPTSTVDEPVVATYRSVTATPPITLPLFGPVFDLAALEYDSGNPLMDFQRPVTISARYGDGEIEGLDEPWLALHTWDETDDVWTMIPTSVDVTRDRATAQVEHSSIYALLEREHSIVFLPLVAREQGGIQ